MDKADTKTVDGLSCTHQIRTWCVIWEVLLRFFICGTRRYDNIFSRLPTYRCHYLVLIGHLESRWRISEFERIVKERGCLQSMRLEWEGVRTSESDQGRIWTNWWSPNNFVEVSSYGCGVLKETSDDFLGINDEYCTYLEEEIRVRWTGETWWMSLTYCVRKSFFIYIRGILVV